MLDHLIIGCACGVAGFVLGGVLGIIGGICLAAWHEESEKKKAAKGAIGELLKSAKGGDS